jgi:hypothetical protein
MNNYGQMVLDHYRQHRRTELAWIADPIRYFTTVDEEIQVAVTDLRDQILGPSGRANPQDYRHRTYQALRQAEELVHSRPHRSNHNPFSEAQFKSL